MIRFLGTGQNLGTLVAKTAQDTVSEDPQIILLDLV